MKATAIRLMFLFVLGFGLSGCRSNPVMYQQFTSDYTDCKSDEVQILDAQAELNSEERWTATCKGKTYYCTYHSSAGLDCTEIDK